MKVIVTLTMNPTIDASSGVRHVVADRKLRCQKLRREPGGGGINVSRAIRILGGKSIAVFTSGGANGKLLQDLLQKEGLNIYPVPVKGITRTNLTIMEKSSGRQFRFIMPGARLDESEWTHCLQELTSVIPKPDYIIASGSLPPGMPEDFYGRVADLATQMEARLIVDTSDFPLRLAAQAGVYLLKPNMNELQELAGYEIKEESQQEKAAKDIIEKGHSKIVVVSLGAAGALMVSREGHVRFRAPSVPVKSKVGAGDSMLAGIVLSLAQGKPLMESVRFGVAAGSSAVITPGSQLCQRESTENLYNLLLSEKKAEVK